MIWHIFRKDWKLLWWKLLIVEALLICVGIEGSTQGHFSAGGFNTWENASALLVFVAGLFLLADLTQLDPPAGMGQDWVARPIKRVDMLLAKLLFLFIAVVPMGAIEVTQNLATGFPPGRSLAGAGLDMLSAFASTGLPFLAFACLFNSLTETVAAAFVGILAKIALGYLLEGNGKFPMTGPASGSAIGWLIDYGQSWIYCAGALVILGIQYFRRKTIRARWVAGAALVVTSLAPLLPWQYAFAVEKRLSPMPDAGAGANIFFNPSSGQAFDAMNAVCIPIAVSGVANGSWLNIDSVQATLLDGDKAVWTRRVDGGDEASTAMWGQMRGGNLMGTKTSGSCQPIEPISIPRDELTQFEDRPMRVQLDYSLTLFGPDKSSAMPAVGGDQRMPGVGWCQTRGSDPLEIGCISDNGPACLQAWTANAPTSTAWFCRPDYDAIRSVSTDPWGSTLGLKVHKGETLVLRSYRPLDHFERIVTTPDIKLHDWITAGQ